MLAVFRVEAGTTSGVGHLMRCLALAQALDENSADVVFIMRQSSRDLALTRRDWVGRILVIPDAVCASSVDEIPWIQGQLSQFPTTPAQLTRQPNTIFILDGYQFSSHYREQLKSALKIPIVLFDDCNDSGELHADLIINAAPHAIELNYPATAPAAVLCLGSANRILRREFLYLPDVAWSQKHSLTLVFGGSDIANLTINTLRVLQNMAWQAPVRVLTGAAYHSDVELAKVMHSCEFAVQHISNCQCVAEVFCYSKLVVSAAGSSQFELHACATPSILVTVADNQVGATRAAAQQGWCQTLDMRDGTVAEAGQLSPAIAQLGQLIQDVWQDEPRLRQMHTAAKRSKPPHSSEVLLDALFALP